MMEKIADNVYFSSLTHQFPALKAEIDALDDLNHLKMEVFARYTNSQIQKRNAKEFIRCLMFQESMMDVMSAEIENALYVSYIESLLLGQYSAQMKKKVAMMPPKFKEKYVEYAIHYYNLGKK
ncbi:MAG: hypothetical protein RL757_2618 [Bacteroidota bacterium]|jgi:hypothetical protein